MVPSLIVVALVNAGDAEGRQVLPGNVKSATGAAAMVNVIDSGVVLLQPLAVVTLKVIV